MACPTVGEVVQCIRDAFPVAAGIRYAERVAMRGGCCAAVYAEAAEQLRGELRRENDRFLSRYGHVDGV